MAEDAKTPGIKMGDLKKLIQDTVQEAVKGVGTPPATPPGGGETLPVGGREARGQSIAEKVKEEIEKIRAKEAEEDEKKTIQTKLNELSEKTKEKAPVERSLVHRLMGWGEND